MPTITIRHNTTTHYYKIHLLKFIQYMYMYMQTSAKVIVKQAPANNQAGLQEKKGRETMRDRERNRQTYNYNQLIQIMHNYVCVCVVCASYESSSWYFSGFLRLPRGGSYIGRFHKDRLILTQKNIYINQLTVNSP